MLNPKKIKKMERKGECLKNLMSVRIDNIIFLQFLVLCEFLETYPNIYHYIFITTLINYFKLLTFVLVRINILVS